MNAKATVRVIAEGGGDTKPDRSRLEAAASMLVECGFQVNRIGRFGVNIEGPAETFEKALGVCVVPDEATVATARPAEPELSKLVDLVEIASAPTLFSK